MHTWRSVLSRLLRFSISLTMSVTSLLHNTVVDPERFSPDPDPTFQVVPDPESTRSSKQLTKSVYTRTAAIHFKNNQDILRKNVFSCEDGTHGICGDLIPARCVSVPSLR
jgi:hypothetical protein